MLQENQIPRGQVRIVYLGPVAPHWDVQGINGDRKAIDEFRQRVNARSFCFLPMIRSSGATVSGS